ncbi:DUF6089 family protein [Spirosoma agri]|uniref:DUF6089 domain-containing protein n=1 Tax=Spirosoma agri TaxID=1987381 RepID=A0A6M0IS44_9BACT|nr:DUF6089 family protein [Spirosoma agri]NEU70924.1 hypothetical protein [Spirosoma agri]
MNRDKYVLVLCALLGLTGECVAQRKYNTRFIPYDLVTVGAGSSTYFGDLASYKHPFKSLTTLPRWNIGLGYTRQFTPHFSARVMFTWARITGDDYTYSNGNLDKYSFQYARNLHFRNDVKEVAIVGIYNFLADGINPYRRAKITPYIFGGLAVIGHDPEARTPTATNGNNSEFVARQWVKLQPLHTEGQDQSETIQAYSRISIAIPIGFGIRYKLNDSFNVGLDIGFRYTFTNYLDDVGGLYAGSGNMRGLTTLMADRRFEYDAARVNTSRYTAAQQLFQDQPALFVTTERSKNELGKDSYLLSNFSIQYVFPGRIKCPPIR